MNVNGLLYKILLKCIFDASNEYILLKLTGKNFLTSYISVVWVPGKVRGDLGIDAGRDLLGEVIVSH